MTQLFVMSIFCTHYKQGFLQIQSLSDTDQIYLKNKISESFKKLSLNLPHDYNYLHSIYVVSATIYMFYIYILLYYK